MKRIVIEQTEIVTLNDISDASIVGMQWEDGSKGMIISTPEGFCSVTNRSRPNTWNVWYTKTAREYVERSSKQGNNTNSKAFVFDTVTELYEWMSKL